MTNSPIMILHYRLIYNSRHQLINVKMNHKIYIPVYLIKKEFSNHKNRFGVNINSNNL